MSRLSPEEVGLHSLRPKPGSRRPRKRIGRGGGSGTGKTSGRGHKGAGARSGTRRKPGYEGGQNPIHMRMRKLRGPHHKMSMPFEPFRTRTQPVNVADLEQRFDAGSEVTPDTLREVGLAKRRHPVKILGRGDVSKKLTVRAHAFSATAREKLEAAGGTCEVIASPAEPDARASEADTTPDTSEDVSGSEQGTERARAEDSAG
jgi:large subunit ribosomal protein L15